MTAAWAIPAGSGGAPVPGASVCRFCGAPLSLALLDLGELPLANSYLAPADLAALGKRPMPF